MEKKKLNKIISIIMLFFTLFNVVQPVFAASGSGTWSGAQYDSEMKTTDNDSGTKGILIRRLNNLKTGEKRTVFCAEHGVDFKTGTSYNGIYYTPTDSNIRKACKIAYLGWYKNNGEYTVDGGILADDMKWVKWDYVFTQQFIWETLGQSTATFIKDDEQQGYIDFKNRINSEIASIETRPSFNGITITIQAGESTDYESAVDFTFSITDDETEINEIAKKTKHLVVNNEQLETYIKLVKKDKNTEKNVTLNSTTFEIKATKDIYDRATKKKLFEKGETISQKVGNTTYTSFTTNADNIVVPANSYNSKNDNSAEVTTPLKLPVGSYEIKEIKVPDGFLQLDSAVIFDIKNVKDYDTDKDGYFIKEVVIKNEQPTGKINLNKTIALREDVDTSLFDTSDLSDIEFKLLAKEDIIDKADGSIIYNKGQEINRYNLTKEGKLTINNLPIGQYELVEVKTLDGLVLNDKKYEIIFEKKDLTTKVYTKDLDISNDTTIVEFSKTDITGDGELVGAKLTILDSDNNIIDTWTSSEKTHKIEGLVIGKEYILKEEIAPKNFVISSDVKFTVDNTKEIQKVRMVDKIVEITKTDLTNGNELEGAELEVIDEDANTIDKWISTKEPHKVKGLEEGKTYTLKETTAPYGYEITEEITFVVTTEKETQKIEMKDMPILKNIKIVKVDSETKETIKDKFIFAIYEDPACTKLIKEVKSNKEDGTALFEELIYGTYYIKEIKAPKDYELSDRIVKVQINDEGIFIDDNQVEEIDSTIEFTFENKKIEVPKTGDESNIKLFAGIILLSLVGIVYIVIKNYKKNKN